MVLKVCKGQKRAARKTIKKRDGKAVAAPKAKKVKLSPVKEMPQHLEEERDKQAEEQETTEASLTAEAVWGGEVNIMGISDLGNSPNDDE
ncbi:hypothetical protein LEMLEM_LOCUS18092 [Lemmus lemmus]